MSWDNQHNSKLRLLRRDKLAQLPSEILKNQIAVVTGSTRGIGLIITRALLQAGAKVVICGRTAEPVQATVAQLDQAFPEQVIGTPCDVTDRQQVEQLRQFAQEHWGQIHVWFNNAGVTSAYGPALTVPTDSWRLTIETNLFGAYHGTLVALEHMVPCQQGKIINLLGAGAQDSSTAQLVNLGAYAASKAAVRRFTLVTAREYRDSKVSILGFNPGLFPTDLMGTVQPTTEAAAQRLKLLEKVGLKYFATTPEAIAQRVVYLASSATDGVTEKCFRCPFAPLTIARRLWQRH